MITLHFIDGGRGDADGIANGVIVDPGGPGGFGGGLGPGGGMFGPNGPGGEGGSGPTANDDEVETDEDTPARIYYLAYNDTDPELDTLTVVEVLQPTHGATELESDGSVTYTPDLNWNGTDSFTYTVSDGTSNASATATITVYAVNDLAVADGLTISTNEDTPVEITLSGTDVEAAELGFFIESGPADGTLGELDGSKITYAPNGNFSGTDSFTYRADDGTELGTLATVTITVNEIADGPGITIAASGGSTRVTEPGFNSATTDSYDVCNAPLKLDHQNAILIVHSLAV
jgi:VCBS repeat-containing protein